MSVYLVIQVTTESCSLGVGTAGKPPCMDAGNKNSDILGKRLNILNTCAISPGPFSVFYEELLNGLIEVFFSIQSRGWVGGAANIQRIKLKRVGNRMGRVKPEMSAI